MKHGFLLTQVQCQNCDKSWNVTPVIRKSLDELKNTAAQFHAENKLDTCIKPRLIELYVPCLVSNEIFEPQPPIIVTQMEDKASASLN